MGLGVLIVAIVIMAWRPSGPVPTVAISFLGFTNTGRIQEGIFAISNPPNAMVGLESVRWQANPGSQVHAAGHFSSSMRETWGLRYAIGVHETNQLINVVFRFQERATGPMRLVELVREWIDRALGKEREFFTGRVFFVTNETRVAAGEP